MTSSSTGHSFDDFIKLNKLGEGTYGVVFKVPSTAIREIALLKELQHPNIVCLKDVLMQEAKLYLIFEYLTMDLKKYIDTHRQARIDPMLVKSWTYQLLQGILFCHQRRTLHRDLKPANLLIDEHGAIKIADFGLARAFGIPVRVYTHEVVTLWYRAPEVLLGSPKYSCPLDVWSLGTIFAEMLNRKPLFQVDSEIDQLFRIFRVLRTPTEQIWPGVTSFPDFKSTFPMWNTFNLKGSMKKTVDSKALDLLEQMLVYDPSKRLSAKRALLHPYFDSLDKQALPAKPGEYQIKWIYPQTVSTQPKTNTSAVPKSNQVKK